MKSTISPSPGCPFTLPTLGAIIFINLVYTLPELSLSLQHYACL